MSSSPPSTTLLTPPPVNMSRTGRTRKPIQRFGTMVDSDEIEVPEDEDERYQKKEEEESDEEYDIKTAIKAWGEEEEEEEEAEEDEEMDDEGSGDEVKVKKPKKTVKAAKGKDGPKKKREMKPNTVKNGSKAPVSSSSRSSSAFTGPPAKKLIPLSKTKAVSKVEMKKTAPVKKPVKVKEQSPSREDDDEDTKAASSDAEKEDHSSDEDSTSTSPKSTFNPVALAAASIGTRPDAKGKKAATVAVPRKETTAAVSKKKSHSFVPVQLKKAGSLINLSSVTASKSNANKEFEPKSSKSAANEDLRREQTTKASDHESGGEEEDVSQVREDEDGGSKIPKTKKPVGKTKSPKKPKDKTSVSKVKAQLGSGAKVRSENGDGQQDKTKDRDDSATPSSESKTSAHGSPHSEQLSQPIVAGDDLVMPESDMECDSTPSPTPTKKRSTTAEKNTTPSSGKKRKLPTAPKDDEGSQSLPKKKPASPEKVTTPFRLAIIEALVDPSYTKTIDFKGSFGSDAAKLNRHWREVLSVDLKAAFGGPGAKVKASAGSITASQRAKLWKIVCDGYAKADWQSVLEKGQEATGGQESGMTTTRLKRHFRDVMRKEAEKVVGN